MDNASVPGYESLHCGNANSSMWMLRTVKQDLEKYPFVARELARRKMGIFGRVGNQTGAERIRRKARRVLKRKIKVVRTRLRLRSSLYGSIHSPDPDALRCFEERAGLSLAEDITAHDDAGIRNEIYEMCQAARSTGWWVKPAAISQAIVTFGVLPKT
jgi:hypothetical protein